MTDQNKAGGEATMDFLAAHEDVVKRVLERQPADEYLYELAELFKVFGDSTRIKILYALFESDLCVGDFRHRQPFAVAGVDEIHIPQLKAGDRLRAHIVQILLEIVGAAGHVEERQPAQFFARRDGIAGQRHLVDARAIWQLREVQIFLDARQYKIAGPVNRAVAVFVLLFTLIVPFALRYFKRGLGYARRVFLVPGGAAKTKARRLCPAGPGFTDSNGRRAPATMAYRL